MKVAFDTNVLLDAIAHREHAHEAQALILAVAEEKIYGVVTANSVTDIYYIARKYVGDENARSVIGNILDLFEIAPIDGHICNEALNIEMSDYEDAVLAVCANSVNADCIVTRDELFISTRTSPVPARRPSDIIALINSD